MIAKIKFLCTVVDDIKAVSEVIMSRLALVMTSLPGDMVRYGRPETSASDAVGEIAIEMAGTTGLAIMTSRSVGQPVIGGWERAVPWCRRSMGSGGGHGR